MRDSIPQDTSGPNFSRLLVLLHLQRLVKIWFLAAELRCSILAKLHEFAQLDWISPGIVS